MSNSNKIYTSTNSVLQFNRGDLKNVRSTDNTKTENNIYPLSPATNLSLQHEPVADYEEFQHNVCVSSIYRNYSIYPSPNRYRIDLEEPLKNVSKLEMSMIILPDAPGILDEPALYLQVDGFNHIEFPNSSVQSAFAVIPARNPTKPGGFMVPELGCIYSSPNVLRSSIASLSSFLISIVDINGNLFDFGQDANPPNKLIQNVMVFKVTTLEKKISHLGQRSIY